MSEERTDLASPMFEIENLHAEIDSKEILKGLNLTVNQGEIHALMGPNGSGKSTLAYVIAGDPRYEVTEGSIRFLGEDILEWSPDERARKGLFLAFQYPTVIPGVSMANFLRMAVTSVRNARAEASAAEGGSVQPMTPREFRRLMREKMALLKMDDSFATRYLNEGFSGGEKKRAEILQMALLEPTMAVLDETDSGLDIDALKVVSEGVNNLSGPDVGMLLITHYQRLLNFIKPDFVHIMMDGRIVESGGPELALELEEKGYEGLRARFAEVVPALNAAVQRRRKQGRNDDGRQATDRRRGVSVWIPRRRGLRFQERARAESPDRRGDLGDEGRARLDARFPAQGAGSLREAANAQLGRRSLGHRFRQHLLLHPTGGEAGTDVG
jgi:Fe-S cluster assembly ATP-binding protein